MMMMTSTEEEMMLTEERAGGGGGRNSGKMASIWGEFRRGRVLSDGSTWEDDVKPERKHYYDAKCHHCGLVLSGRPERMKQHLISNCVEVPAEVKSQWLGKVSAPVSVSTNTNGAMLLTKTKQLMDENETNRVMVRLLEEQMRRRQKVLKRHQEELDALDLLFSREKGDDFKQCRVVKRIRTEVQYENNMRRKKNCCVICSRNAASRCCNSCRKFATCNNCKWDHHCSCCGGYCKVCALDTTKSSKLVICDCGVCSNCCTKQTEGYCCKEHEMGYCGCGCGSAMPVVSID